MSTLRSVIGKWSAVALVAFGGAAYARPIMLTFLNSEFNDAMVAGDSVSDIPFTFTQAVDTTQILSCGSACRSADASGTMVDLGTFDTAAIETPTEASGDAFGFIPSLVEEQAIVAPDAVPEPEALLLMGVGALGLAIVRRRRR